MSFGNNSVTWTIERYQIRKFIPKAGWKLTKTKSDILVIFALAVVNRSPHPTARPGRPYFRPVDLLMQFEVVRPDNLSASGQTNVSAAQIDFGPTRFMAFIEINFHSARLGDALYLFILLYFSHCCWPLRYCSTQRLYLFQSVRHRN